MAGENDRILQGIEQGLWEVKHEVGEIKSNIASLQTTVELLVQGKIKQDGNPTSQSDGYHKIVLAALEIARMAVAGLVGFFAGRGGN